MVSERADRVIIVTSGTFTGEAAGFARGKPVELVDGKALVELRMAEEWPVFRA